MQIRLVLVAVALVGTAACGSTNSSNTTASPSTTTPSTTTTSSGQTTTVTIPVGAQGLTTTAYAPNPVNIRVGDSVNWVNNDSIAHTSTANNGTTFNSGTIAPGGSFRTTFSTAGSFAYHCAFHPGMIGTVNVQ
jgi:plastocyanin